MFSLVSRINGRSIVSGFDKHCFDPLQLLFSKSTRVQALPKLNRTSHLIH
jgi:hypothetical protein